MADKLLSDEPAERVLDAWLHQNVMGAGHWDTYVEAYETNDNGFEVMVTGAVLDRVPRPDRSAAMRNDTESSYDLMQCGGPRCKALFRRGQLRGFEYAGACPRCRYCWDHTEVEEEPTTRELRVASTQLVETGNVLFAARRTYASAQTRHAAAYKAVNGEDYETNVLRDAAVDVVEPT